MAWVADADFNGLSVADLNGQSGGTGWSAAWSGSANYDVQASVAYEGANGVQNASGSNISRALTTEISGSADIVYFAMRKTSVSAGGAKMRLLNPSGDIRVQIIMDPSGNIEATASGTVRILTGYSADTWYAFRVTTNIGAGTYTVATSTDAYGTNGSFGTESSSCTMSNTGNIGQVMLDADTGNTCYWDYISPTTPFVTPSGPVGIKSWNGLTVR